MGRELRASSGPSALPLVWIHNPICASHDSSRRTFTLFTVTFPQSPALFYCLCYFVCLSWNSELCCPVIFTHCKASCFAALLVILRGMNRSPSQAAIMGSLSCVQRCSWSWTCVWCSLLLGYPNFCASHWRRQSARAGRFVRGTRKSLLGWGAQHSPRHRCIPGVCTSAVNRTVLCCICLLLRLLLCAFSMGKKFCGGAACFSSLLTVEFEDGGGQRGPQTGQSDSGFYRYGQKSENTCATKNTYPDFQNPYRSYQKEGDRNFPTKRLPISKK